MLIKINYIYFTFRLETTHPIDFKIFPNTSEYVENVVEEYDVHVYTINSIESKNYFIDLYSLRTNLNKEYWLVDVSYWNDIEEVYEEFQNLKLDLNDDLYLYQKNSNIFVLWEMYQIHQNIPKKILKYGKWSIEKGLIIENKSKWDRRKNLEVCRVALANLPLFTLKYRQICIFKAKNHDYFQGIKFRATTLEYAPRVSNLVPIPGNPDEYTADGIFPDIFNELKEYMNFTFSLKKSPDGQWGAILANGSWTGMVKDLQNDVFDVGS